MGIRYLVMFLIMSMVGLSIMIYGNIVSDDIIFVIGSWVSGVGMISTIILILRME